MPRSSGRSARDHGTAAKSRRRTGGTWGRYLWALVTSVVIAALLFEFTMLWTIGVGFYMLALREFTGLWFLVGGYALACVPAAFGLLIATGQFWRSLTHALWIGLVYGLLGFFLLDRILGAL
ncbi:hypothetical protein [Nesterenkonia sp. HG001]|uniref:hypothetical protein n=1 Tax=Nesterenkonia sp. HG001 TaxID=2983207 RepID=UPI002AC6E1DA|nr:hypothetical protein [Nesterenkonia sp. HG001]MDZ5077337.1 hypothetical protein [Nesterenkonia sp. HG001]